jgi:MoxR-like ATPase
MTETPSSSELAVAEAQAEAFRRSFTRVIDAVGRFIVGQRDVVEGTLTALLSGGHVLLEGVPGLGKTMLVRTLSQVTHLRFARIQFTPDLMPADITGTDMVMENEHGQRFFQFQPGPIFAHVVLADEINRATPKTQSALLEAMQDKSVTIGKTTYELERPFFVMATQNPIEMEGTYPLPEAQVDRFFFKLKIGYPDAAELDEVLRRTTAGDPPEVERLLTRDDVLALRQVVRQVPIAAPVQQYAVALVLATHPDSPRAPEAVKRYVRYGASPRGGQALVTAARIRALLAGRFHVAQDDLRAVALPSLRHRLILTFEGQAEGIDPDRIIQTVIEQVGEV